MKTTITVGIALLALLLIGMHNMNKPIFTSEESSANFSQNDKVSLRYIIYKAGALFNPSRELIASYIKNETAAGFSGFWNVAVFTRQDLNAKFYLTGTYDSTHLNKRYFQVIDSEPYGYSVLILETNNTYPDSPVQKKMVLSQPSVEQFSYSKTKSLYVTTSQEAGIDLAITTAYTWNKNIIDFTKVLQKLVETNLGEHWEVCTNIQTINFRFLYTSPYQQWVEYTGYGLSNPHWHVYLYRNYLTG